MKLGIVFGGVSYEHEISIVSAIAMKDVINAEFVYIFLDQNRDFYHIPTQIIKSKLFSSGEYKKCEKVSLKKSGFYTQGGFLSKEKLLDMDLVLNIMHGADGEDGVIASLFEFNNISYIGPRREACSVSFNKFLTKGYASSIGVKTIDYKYFTKNDKIEIDEYPVIIKPVRLGSSIGVTIVNNTQELEYALDVAFEFDDAIIVEPFIKGIKEYNLAGCKIAGEFNFSIIEEPQKADFLDFDKKYLDFSRTSKALKADISEELQEEIKKNFKAIYNTLFDGAIIRCDFFVKDNEVYLNEINPVPGSMANYLFSNFDEIIKNLATSLPKTRKITINYEYVNKIQASKGK
ncbi:D-alanine--D-alanine ligase [Malaciobacter mytili]|uniref:D-alanine--D-alanine ligase n=1 Tax=Malaciobacter mytili LMG 24559 TaxID=1032238 RepID=A0AAX2AIB3_9BACT|nr:D-alanine--D-alanine ligase [Malaciobacter mytili]AXH14543.1 D-alanine--D-alanine ligase [Malaciobacter mytili LMG 24559]RXI45001.1 D-alanine--D-alanine ligase [Malaciobacter mytili]RXK16598.1 D-alanine--D-alanine ligase [Malaciobacter mytili LMG 24559]